MKLDNSLPTQATDADARLRQRATDAAVKFEAQFIRQMLSQMRSATRELADDDSPSKQRTHEQMADFADGLVADSLAGQRAFGIADLLLKQLLPAPDLSAAPPQSPSRN
ncbi:MAG: flagellar biosynthesis protein FlgJ [Comamonadaceae bacterium]|nr:flagellar biosynthesis protein FlgJ [Comamonadaceae bacterium]